MSRWLLRPTAKPLGRQICLPSPTIANHGSGSISSSRGIKMSKVPLNAMVLDPDPEVYIPRGAAYFGNFTSGGKELLTKLGKHHIGLNSEMKMIKSARDDRKRIEVKVANRHTVYSYDIRYFTETGNSYTEAITRRYLRDNDTKPLWFQARVLVNDTKSIIRGMAKYRINAAFKQALRNAGYDPHGSKLPEGPRGAGAGAGAGDSKDWKRKIMRVYGSVEITAHDAKVIHHVTFAELRQFFAEIVDYLEERLGRDSDGCLVKGIPDKSPPSWRQGKKPGGSKWSQPRRRSNV